MAKQVKVVNKGGRPSSFRPEFVEQTYKLCLKGAIDAELADFFGVAESTINNWKHSRPEFADALRRGKEAADAEVAHALYDKAIKGDTTAMIFWLKSRCGWRDRQAVELSGSVGTPVVNLVIEDAGA